MNVVARVRLVLARRPWLYWTAVALLGGGIAVTVAGATSGVEDARRAWGEPRGVLVATADLAPGDPLEGAVSRQARPTPMIPAAALAEAPAEAVARQHVAAGEIVVDRDVAPTAAPQALIPDGWAAVAVAEAVPSGVRIGDEVRPVAGGVELAASGVVVGHRGDAVLVAVPAADAAAVAHAASTGGLGLVITP
jgi:hypothetical protein